MMMIPVRESHKKERGIVFNGKPQERKSFSVRNDLTSLGIKPFIAQEV